MILKSTFFSFISFFINLFVYNTNNSIFAIATCQQNNKTTCQHNYKATKQHSNKTDIYNCDEYY